jgi:glycosyltransferase involved in cell wall biosynthesis
MMITKVSIVIPTLNCAEVLEQCLISIRRNICKYDYEVIIVDGSSRDDTVAVAGKYADRILIEETFFRGVNRNKGVKAAAGEVICFTDSDCVVPENWINTLVDWLIELNKKDPGIVGVGGGNLPFVPPNADTKELAISCTLRTPLISFGARNMVEKYDKPVEVDHNPPVNSALFKEKILEVKGFCEKNNIGEDLILDARLRAKDYKLYAVPGCEVLHKHRSGFAKLIKQMFAFGQARVRTGRIYPSFFSWYHWGPAILSLLTLSPLIVIPFLLSLTNGAYVIYKNKRPSLFFYAFGVTWSTYFFYGLGEIIEFIRRKK